MTNKGLAYIEVLIASAILTAALIPSYGYFTGLAQSQLLGENYLKVRSILETKIEQERSKSVDQLVVGQQVAAVNELPAGQITTDLTDIGLGQPSLYRLEIQLNWQEPGGEKTVQAATLINPEGYIL